MAAKQDENLLVTLIAGLFEAILSILMLPFYLITGILTLMMGSFAVVVIALLFLGLAVLCGLTVVTL